MTEAAGIEVRYPLLDDRLVAFADRLPVDYKVRGTRLRWFFKEALRDCCPRRSSTREARVRPAVRRLELASTRRCGKWSRQPADLGRRGWVKPAYLDRHAEMQREEHATYYGMMIWVTMMLERVAAGEWALIGRRHRTAVGAPHGHERRRQGPGSVRPGRRPHPTATTTVSLRAPFATAGRFAYHDYQHKVVEVVEIGQAQEGTGAQVGDQADLTVAIRSRSHIVALSRFATLMIDDAVSHVKNTSNRNIPSR